MITYCSAIQQPIYIYIYIYIFVTSSNLTLLLCYPLIKQFQLASLNYEFTIEILYTDLVHKFHGNFLLVLIQCNDMSYGQLNQILHHYINTLLLESCRCNKRLYYKTESWSVIYMMWWITNKFWWYCMIMLGYSVLMLMIFHPLQTHHLWKAFLEGINVFVFSAAAYVWNILSVLWILRNIPRIIIVDRQLLSFYFVKSLIVDWTLTDIFQWVVSS